MLCQFQSQKFMCFLNLFSDLKRWICDSYYQHSSFSIWYSIHHMHNCIDTCPCRIHCNHIWLTWCLVPYKVGIVPEVNNYPGNSLHCTAFPSNNVSIIPWSHWLIDERYNLFNKWLFFLGKNMSVCKDIPFFPKCSLHSSLNFISDIFWLKFLNYNQVLSSRWSKPYNFAFFCWASHIRCLKYKMISLTTRLMLYIVSDDAFYCSASCLILFIKIPDLPMQY